MEIAACPLRRSLLEEGLKSKEDKYVLTASNVVLLLSKYEEARHFLLRAGVLNALAFLICEAQACREIRAVMMAFSGLVSGSSELQSHVCLAFPAVVTNTLALLESSVDYSVQCCWLLFRLVRGNASIQDVFVNRFGVLDALISMIGRKDVAVVVRVHVAWVLQATLSGNLAIQMQAYEKKAVAAVFELFNDAKMCSAVERESATASAIWVLGTLADGVVKIQDELRLHPHIFRCLVDQLACESNETHVHYQACLALYTLASNNPTNQSTLGAMGCVEALFKVLDAPWKTSKTLGAVVVHTATEKVLSAILCLCVNHAENQERVGAALRHLQLLVQLLDSPVVKIRGLAAGMLRMGLHSSVAEAMFPQLLASGVFYTLLRMVLRVPDAKQPYSVFAQEQACAALYNFVQNPRSEDIFVDSKNRIDAVNACCELVASSVKVSPKQGGCSALALTCAIMTVRVIVQDEIENGPEETETCTFSPEFMEALRRCASNTCPDDVLAAHAWHLLITICPEEKDHDETRLVTSLIQGLTAVKRPLQRLANDADGTTGACGICMEGLQDDEVYVPCFHSFHRACILRWLCIKDECPTCRQPVLRNIRKLELNLYTPVTRLETQIRI